MTRTEHFFSPCPRGLETVLESEIRTLGGVDTVVHPGGVAYQGEWLLGYRMCLHSRIASRVLWRQVVVPYRNEQDVYKATAGVPWENLIRPDQTIMVKLEAVKSPLKSLNFATLRIKDGVCDRLRDHCGSRPDVDTRSPDVRIHAFLSERELTLYLDLAGDPLFMRGYRVAQHEAPLRENLAAGIIRLTGWDPAEPFFDPMCGSGTFLIEAALIGCNIPPGMRRRFAFERLKNFDAAAWEALRAEARAGIRSGDTLAIYGSDLFGDVLKVAWENVVEAGVDDCIALKQGNILEIHPPAGHGVLVTNPPYGVRLEHQAQNEAFYAALGDALKRRFAGWRAYLFTHDLKMVRAIRLHASRKTPLFNGPLECRLLEYKIISGSNRREEPTEAVPD